MTQHLTAHGTEKKLGENACARIVREIAKYPEGRQRSAAIASLAIAQEELGWLTPEVLAEVADCLDMPLIAIQEIASFYSMFDTKPVGRYKLGVCTGLPCELHEGTVNAVYLQNKLGIVLGQTTEDGLITLVSGECMGSCGEGPVILVNNRHMQVRMTNAKTDDFLDRLKAGLFEDVLQKE